MAKYTTQIKQLSDWLKKALLDIGDGEARKLNQLIAKAKLEGFKEKDILSVLDTYNELGGVDYNLKKNWIISSLNLKNVVLAKWEEKEAIKDIEEIKEATPTIEEDKSFVEFKQDD